MKVLNEKVASAFAELINTYGFVLNIRSEGAIKIITLKNEYIKISFTEEYQPRNIYNVTLFDGKNFWLGLSTLFEFKGISFEYELGCIKVEDFHYVAKFLINNYSDLLLGNEVIKQNILNFYLNKS